MSIYNIIAVSTVGVATSVFNAMISSSGYVAPEIVDGVTVAATQSAAVKSVITFAFVGLETITGVILAILLLFLNVEKNIAKKQAKIREYQKSHAEANGEEWIAPEVRAALDEEKYLLENEEAFVASLQAKCARKGLDFDAELAAHNEKIASAKAKNQQRKTAEEQKQAEAKRKAQLKLQAKLDKMTEQQRAEYQRKLAERQKRDEEAWQKELATGEAYRARIQAELETR